jgi:hypothetical protein
MADTKEGEGSQTTAQVVEWEDITIVIRKLDKETLNIYTPP